MIVEGNGFSYALENRLVKKLDTMIERITNPKQKLDAWLAIHGAEGAGKTGTSTAIAYYIKQKTNREVHLHFRLAELIKLAKDSEGKIFIWDEPSLDSLSTDQLKKIGRDLLRLVMTIRKKRHFFIINFTKFWKFPEYVVVDRCLGMVHMYSRKEIQMGRFFYIKKARLESLWNDYAKSKKRNYKKLSSFGGVFPDIMAEHFDKMDFFVEGVQHATYKQYEMEKDKAIHSIGEDDQSVSKQVQKLRDELNTLKGRIARMIPKEIKTKHELAIALGVHPKSLLLWSKNPDKAIKRQESPREIEFNGSIDRHINNSMVNLIENPMIEAEGEANQTEKQLIMPQIS